MTTHSTPLAPLASLLLLGAFAAGCAFDPNAASEGDDANENTGSVQQAAIVYADPSSGLAPTCGNYETGADGLCYEPCPEGFTGVVSRCVESCGVRTGTCARREMCNDFGWGSPYECVRLHAPQATDRGAGVPPSCALMGRVKGRDGKCYALTGSSPPVPVPSKPSKPQPQETGPAESPAAKACNHSLTNGQSNVWYKGRCLTAQEYRETILRENPPQVDNTPDLPCVFANGCDWAPPSGTYDVRDPSTGWVTAPGFDLHPTLP